MNKSQHSLLKKRGCVKFIKDDLTKHSSFHFHFIIFLLFTFISIQSTAQVEDELIKQNLIEQRIESISENFEDGGELDFTNLFDVLSFYYEHPLNLNSATAEELGELQMLSDYQIRALLIHVKKYGVLRSLFELQAVDGFDIHTIRQIEPFVFVGEPGMWSDFSFGKLFSEGKNDLFLRYKRVIQKQAGFLSDEKTGEAPVFAGSADYYYTRYRFQYRRNVQLGITMEKDAGESLEGGPDYLSMHLFYRDKSWLKTLAIGDFQAQFGQGLTFWNGLGFGKSPFVLNIKRNAQGFKPYSSVNEFQFLRGIATTVAVKSLEFSAFYSDKKIDANVTDQTDTIFSDDEFVVSSFLEGGLHRTEGELADKKVMNENIFGGNIRWVKPSVAIGITAVRTRFSLPVQLSDRVENIFRFSGDENLNVGLDYQTIIRNINLFGEFSMSQNGGWAMLNGMVASLHPSFSISVLHRRFGRDYHVQYFNVFAENSEPRNESGLYLGCQSTFNRLWTLSAYADHVVIPWLATFTSSPVRSTDYLFQLNYKPDKRHEFYFRYRVRDQMRDLSGQEAYINSPEPNQGQTFRLHASYQAHTEISFRTRVEWRTFEKTDSPREQGFLFYQDVIWKRLGFPMSVNLRYALFDGDSWDTRSYAYESTVLYDYSIPPYYGRGSRFYVLTKWDLNRGIDLWLRYGQWLYFDRDVISSGTGEIQGNLKSDFHAQLRWQF